MQALAASEPRNKTDLRQSARRGRELSAPRIDDSDFRPAGDRVGLFKGLKLLRQQGHDVMVFHVMDDDELDFPFSGPTRFEGLELAEHLTCNPRALREGICKAVRDYLAEVRRGCARPESTMSSCAPASRSMPRWRHS